MSSQNVNSNFSTTTTNNASTTTDTIPPTITLMGNNPAEISLGTSYVDVGATATDDSGISIMPDIIENTVDTSKVGEYKVVYTAHDGSMNFATSTRVVKVFDPFAKNEPVASTTASTTVGLLESLISTTTATSTP
jgi:hypothetical protein